jgi:hypothetical protein
MHGEPDNNVTDLPPSVSDFFRRLLAEAPTVEGRQWVVFGRNCLWWSHRPGDAVQNRTLAGPAWTGLACPYCGGRLDQDDLTDFLDSAPDNQHYGQAGVAALVAAHHDNCRTCRTRFDRYGVKIRG